jgi:beta-lactamase class A
MERKKRRSKMKQKFMISSMCVFIILFSCLNTNAQLKAKGPVDNLIQEIVRLEKITGGLIGIGSIHLETEKSFYYNEGVRYPMASTYKLPIAVQLLSRVENGETQLTDMISVEKSDLHPGSGTISQMLDEPGVMLSLHNLLELMLLVSDNSAADLCIKSAGGTAAVTQKMREIGIDDIDISRSTFVLIAQSLGITIFKEGDVYDEIKAYRVMSQLTELMREKAWQEFLSDLRDTATPDAMAKLLQKIWCRKVLNNENSQLLLDIMKRCQTGKDRIRGMLPPGTTVYNKTGTIHKVVNDIGIVRLPGDTGNIVTVIFIKDAKIESDECEKIIAHIARSLYDHFLFSSN